LVAVDGTLWDVPDTSANDASFGRPTSGKRGDGAFPQVRKLSLVEVGTHVEFALCTGSYRTGEKTLFPQLLPHLLPGMLLLCDRGFFSYKLWKSVVSQGVHLLARLFKDNGYATACTGKWGLGMFDTPGSPLKVGFDHFFGYNCQAHALVLPGSGRVIFTNYGSDGEGGGRRCLASGIRLRQMPW
jgi:hypothetical protein